MFCVSHNPRSPHYPTTIPRLLVKTSRSPEFCAFLVHSTLFSSRKGNENNMKRLTRNILTLAFIAFSTIDAIDSLRSWEKDHERSARKERNLAKSGKGSHNRVTFYVRWSVTCIWACAFCFVSFRKSQNFSFLLHV